MLGLLQRHDGYSNCILTSFTLTRLLHAFLVSKKGKSVNRVEKIIKLSSSLDKHMFCCEKEPK